MEILTLYQQESLNDIGQTAAEFVYPTDIESTVQTTELDALIMGIYAGEAA